MQVIAPYISNKTVLVLIQNGVFIEDELFAKFSQPIIRGLAFICSYRLSFTHVQHIDYGGLTLGVKFGNDRLDLTQPVMDVFKLSDIDVTIDAFIDTAIWKKLVWNVAFNPLSIYYGGVTTDWLLNHADSFHKVVAMMDAVVAVAQQLDLLISHQFRGYILNTCKMMSKPACVWISKLEPR